MNKIGILTYHTGFNYGASLQAYALAKVLIDKNAKCEIINFETEQFFHSREPISRKPVRMKEIVKIFFRMPYYRALSQRTKMFDNFKEQLLPLSPLYRTEDEVIANIDKYDCIVCGSDQIWNLGAYGDEFAANMLFFLNFPKKERRISYAASFGYWLKDAYTRENEFLPWLREFDAISIREIDGKNYLESKGISAEVVLDPTLLLKKEDYKKICIDLVVPEKYLLLFSWSTPKKVINIAKQIAKRLNLKIYNIVPPPRAMFSGIKRKLDVGPREFLGLIKNADFIVTNSFHGTAFATIFEKDFVSIYNKTPDSRIYSLLSQIGLENHLVQDINAINLQTIMETDYSNIQINIDKLREESFKFIEEHILGK